MELKRLLHMETIVIGVWLQHRRPINGYHFICFIFLSIPWQQWKCLLPKNFETKHILLTVEKLKPMNVWHFRLKNNWNNWSISLTLKECSKRNVADICTWWTENPNIHHRSFPGSLKEIIRRFLNPWNKQRRHKMLKSSSSVSLLMPVSHLLYLIHPSTSQHDSAVIHAASVIKKNATIPFKTVKWAVHCSVSIIQASMSDISHNSTWL